MKLGLLVQLHTPLHLAVIEGHQDVTNLLLAAGADPYAEDERVWYSA